MALTKSIIADKSLNRAVMDGCETVITIPEIEEMLDEAVSKLSDRLAKTGKFYRLQKYQQSVSVSAGVGSIPSTIIAETIVNSAGGFITFTRTDITSPQFRGPLKWLKDFAAISRPRPGGNFVGYYTIRGDAGAAKLFVYSGLGSPATGTALVSACQYYTFAAVPDNLEDELIDVLVMMIKERMDKQPAMAAEQGG